MQIQTEKRRDREARPFCRNLAPNLQPDLCVERSTSPRALAFPPFFRLKSRRIVPNQSLGTPGARVRTAKLKLC